MRIAVPDLISPSYFPAEAAVTLGYFAAEGIDAELRLVSPIERAYDDLRRGDIDMVAGSAHSIFSAFPRCEGAKLICAQSQGMYWFLVMRSDLGARRGDIGVVKGRRIGAAPWVGLTLKHLLIQAGFDLERDNITIAPTAGSLGERVNFGLAAARALEEGVIDGFWANGMGAEIAVRSGVGTIVLDVRRGDGPADAFNYTMATLATTDRMLENNPDLARASIRALEAAQGALVSNPELAAAVAAKLFPDEAELIVDLVRRDTPFYSSELTPKFIEQMVGFSRSVGILDQDLSYGAIVAGTRL